MSQIREFKITKKEWELIEGFTKEQHLPLGQGYSLLLVAFTAYCKKHKKKISA